MSDERTARSIADGLDAMLRGEEISWAGLGVSPAALVEACRAAGLSGLAFEWLARFRGVHDWPDGVRGALARDTHVAAAVELATRREIASALADLAAAGVHPILIKGAALAYTVYDGPSSRPRVDTDLLVHREEIDIVRRALSARGYREPPMSGGDILMCQFPLVRTDEWGTEHTFDVHWKISTQPLFADALTFEEADAAAVRVPALSSHARTLRTDHALLLACIHPFMHHRAESRTIWTYDVHLLASRLTAGELDAFADFAIARHVGAVCGESLLRARTRFHTAVPDSIIGRLTERQGVEPSAAYLRSSRRWHHELYSSLCGLPRWSDRLRLLREVLIPAPQYMLAKYRLGGVGFVLLPALYLHRVAAGAWKIAAGRK